MIERFLSHPEFEILSAVVSESRDAGEFLRGLSFGTVQIHLI